MVLIRGHKIESGAGIDVQSISSSRARSRGRRLEFLENGNDIACSLHRLDRHSIPVHEEHTPRLPSILEHSSRVEHAHPGSRPFLWIAVRGMSASFRCHMYASLSRMGSQVQSCFEFGPGGLSLFPFARPLPTDGWASSLRDTKSSSTTNSSSMIRFDYMVTALLLDVDVAGTPSCKLSSTTKTRRRRNSRRR